jgi:transcriptional regulator with XRE-family HTH domain
VDAEPVREHVRTLAQLGIGWRRTAELAGLHNSVVRSLVYGSSGREPCKRIRPETAAAILAVEARTRNVHASRPVDATGTRRRLQALVASGWSRSKLGERLGIEPTEMSQTLRRERVTAGRAQAVADLYDELWKRQPPESEWRDKIAAARSRNYAREHGWAPPLAWDDDQMDQPDAQPAEGWRRSASTRRTAAELAEEAADVMRQGHTIDQAAERLGVHRSAIEHATRRAAAAATQEHETQRARFAAREAVQTPEIEMEAG